MQGSYDVNEVYVPVTGAVAFAPNGTAVPTPEEGKKKNVTLNSAFHQIGLITTDGGFEWTEEPKGERQEFFQQGYSMPSTEATVRVTFTAAQTSRKILEIIRGGKFDEHFHTIVDAAGNPQTFVVWIEEIAKNGVIRRRCGENVKVVSYKAAKSERGSITGLEITLEFDVAAGHPGGQYHEWFITASEVTA